MNKKHIICNQSFDLERSLYNLKDAIVKDCQFQGDADGESCLKETRDIEMAHCLFDLRYPLWHADTYYMHHCEMTENARAPIWYSKNGLIENCQLNGIKLLRECDLTALKNCKIDSPEFGWYCRDIKMDNCKITSPYIFLNSRNIELNNINYIGKYSFQYIENLHIKNSYLDTKDAFWHSSNILVENCTLKGEYLAWFSKNLTLVNCTIIGTQPFCYAENLKLVNCKMIETDLAFEYSSVDADVQGKIESVKNPKSGLIICDEVGEVIFEDAIIPCKGEVKIRNTN